MTLRFALAAVLASGLAAFVSASGAAPVRAARQEPNPDARLQHEFTKRVEGYVALRGEVEAKLPELPEDADPEQLASHRSALLEGIARRRAGAAQGDLFDKETQALIRRMLRDARKLPEGAQAKAAVREEDPGRVKLEVNGKYPEGLPLTTVPPQILLSLPRLPDDDIEYRFVGDRLLLIDSRARMVVDYMDKALP